MIMNKTILIVDAQGGGLGKWLITNIRKELPDATVLAVGTNSAATSAMLKAGATEAATGENAVVVGCRRAGIIVGPLGMVIADSMLGEITPVMARAIGQADAVRIMIPFNNCDNFVAGIKDSNTGKMVSDALSEIKRLVTNGG